MRWSTKRVAIARAIAGDRSLPLADEPTGNLDIQSGKDVLQLFKDLCHDKEQPISILLVTHDPELQEQIECFTNDGRTAQVIFVKLVLMEVKKNERWTNVKEATYNTSKRNWFQNTSKV